MLAVLYANDSIITNAIASAFKPRRDQRSLTSHRVRLVGGSWDHEFNPFLSFGYIATSRQI